MNPTVVSFLCRKETVTMNLTSHERLMRIFQNKEIDRPSLKLWGAHLSTDLLLHPAYKPVAELAAQTTDMIGDLWYPMNVFAGQNMGKYTESYPPRPTARIGSTSTPSTTPPRGICTRCIKSLPRVSPATPLST